MNLAPLADVVAYLDPNASGRALVQRSLAGRFDAVWSPEEGCVMATRALPHSVPDRQDLRDAGVAFAEGRDSVPSSRWSDLALESMPGNVGFARAERQRLVVVRSGPGTVPWYGWQDDERALVATSFTELVRLLPIRPELDPLVCGMWPGGSAMFPEGRSFIRGVLAVPSGHTVEFRPGRPVRLRSWWDPWPQEEMPWPSAKARADNVQRFGDAVLGALDREVAHEPVNLLTLSGGVDSSALAYLVGRRLDRPLGALSFVPPAGAPEAQYAASYLDPIVADLNLAPHIRKPWAPSTRVAMVTGTPPVAFPVFHPALLMLPELVHEHGFEVLVGGEFADEICGGWFALPDWLDAVPFRRLLSSARDLPRGRGDLGAWIRRRRPGRGAPGPWPTSLPEWVHPEINDEYRAWRRTRESELRASKAPHRYQRAVLAWIEGALAMNWEVCSSLGVRRAFPFLTAEVLTALSACHPAELLGPGSKRLERQAFAGVVPDRHLQRPDKGHWGGVGGERVAAPSSPVPTLLRSVLRAEPGPVTPTHAAFLQIMFRFAGHVSTAGAGGVPTA